MFPCIKNVFEVVNLAIKTNKLIIGDRVINKFTCFIKREQTQTLQILHLTTTDVTYCCM